jgi:hypothetical protein
MSCHCYLRMGSPHDFAVACAGSYIIKPHCRQLRSWLTNKEIYIYIYIFIFIYIIHIHIHIYI